MAALHLNKVAPKVKQTMKLPQLKTSRAVSSAVVLKQTVRPARESNFNT